jgi:hypothetical protein
MCRHKTAKWVFFFPPYVFSFLDSLKNGFVWLSLDLLSQIRDRESVKKSIKYAI